VEGELMYVVWNEMGRGDEVYLTGTFIKFDSSP
jgi:hypothetical protein